MSSIDEYKKLLIIGALLGILGSVALILGLFLGFDLFGTTIDIFGLAIISLAVGIFFVSLITFLSLITPQGLTANDERPLFFTLSLFIFTPTMLFSQYTTPLFYLLIQGNDMLASGVDYNFYITFIGVALLLVAFMLGGWIFLWKNRLSSAGGLNLSGGATGNPIVKLLRIITSILTIAAGVGMFLGMVLPISGSIGSDKSLVMNLDGSQLDLTALAFMFLIIFVILSAILVLLGNFGILKISNERPILIAMLLIILVPGYIPAYNELIAASMAWSTPIYEMFALVQTIFIDGSQTSICWILAIGLLAFSLAFIFSILTYFIGTSSTYSKRVKISSGGGLEVKKKKGKFPTGPPSAAPPSLSGPPSSMPSSPPIGGTQPTVTSAPPKPPSFMPTSQTTLPTTKQKEPPTCPFCGTTLRFIDEYQRWYCDSCSSYV